MMRVGFHCTFDHHLKCLRTTLCFHLPVLYQILRTQSSIVGAASDYSYRTLVVHIDIIRRTLRLVLGWGLSPVVPKDILRILGCHRYIGRFTLFLNRCRQGRTQQERCRELAAIGRSHCPMFYAYVLWHDCADHVAAMNFRSNLILISS